MKRNEKKNFSLFFLLLTSLVILPLVLAACVPRQAERSPGQKQQSEEQQNQEQNKILEELKEIKSSLEELTKRLEEKKELQDNPQKLQQLMTQEQAGDKQGGQQGNNQQGKDKEQQEGGGKNGQEGEQGQQPQQSQQPKISPLKDWAKEEEQVTSLHEKWNSFEPKAVKSGINQAEINEFKEKLDELTLAVKSQDIQVSLLAVNGVYKYIPNFMEMFEQENPPDVYRMRYEINEIIYNADSGKWSEAELGIKELKQTWPKVRLKLRSQDADLTEKFEFSVNDLERILAKQDRELVKIKGKIALDNLKQIEEKLKQASQQGAK
ncbi:MAG TPA: hypothetical protein GXX38_00720 [Clostridia bacterium]|nr:hypothetical protein [Clostridia bacterium]